MLGHLPENSGHHLDEVLAQGPFRHDVLSGIRSLNTGSIAVQQLRIPPGRAGRPGDRLGPGLDLADDLDAPMGEIGGNLIRDFGPLDAAALSPAREALIDPARNAASAAANDCRQRLHLPVVDMIIDIETGDPGRLSRPQVALPATDPHKAEIVEL